MLNLSILNKKTDSSETNNLLFYFVTASLGGAINSGGLKRKTPANQNPVTPAPILKDCQIVWEDGFEGTTLNPSKWKYRNEGKPAGKYATNSKNNVELDGEREVYTMITFSNISGRPASSIMPCIGRKVLELNAKRRVLKFS